jgi:hypothetical protein
MNNEQDITMNIPTAAEAAAAIAKGDYERARKQSEEVAAAINKAVAQGAKYAGGDGYLEPSVKAALESKGYKCQHGTQYNESYWSVTW